MMCRHLNSRVKDSRPHVNTEYGFYIQRRRVCEDCGKNFVTIEILRDDLKALFEIKQQYQSLATQIDCVELYKLQSRMRELYMDFKKLVEASELDNDRVIKFIDFSSQNID